METLGEHLRRDPRELDEGGIEKYGVIQDRLFQSDCDTFAALEKRVTDQGDGQAIEEIARTLDLHAAR